MADERANLAQQNEILEKATRRKWNKYTSTGLFVILGGLILIVIGLPLDITTAYSAKYLLIGFGAIFVLAGIIRVLIGLINPMTPADIHPPGERQEDDEGSPIIAADNKPGNN